MKSRVPKKDRLNRKAVRRELKRLALFVREVTEAELEKEGGSDADLIYNLGNIQGSVEQIRLLV